MIDTNKLRGRMAENGVTGVDVANAIGCTPKTFYQKMKKGVFDSDEIDIMIDFLEIERPLDIFFVRK